ncbi:MAG: ATP-binding cassette domain-containing protein [Gemmatimonadales bacterium]
MTAPPLRFENVRLPATEGSGISFDVPSHKAVLVLGSEESGVDTLASLALGLTRLEGGRILVHGEDVSSLAPREALAFRRRVGYLPAGDGLMQNLSLWDNIALPLRFGSDLSTRAIDGRIRIMCTLVGLSSVVHLRPAAASDEQRRRAALARALAFDPELVIMENPFDGLTARTAVELLVLARGGEQEEGSRRTLFMTSQYLPSLVAPRIEIQYRIEKGQFISSD